MSVQTFLVQDPKGVYLNQAVQAFVSGELSDKDMTVIKMLAAERMCECSPGEIAPGVLHDLLDDLEVYSCS